MSQEKLILALDNGGTLVNSEKAYFEANKKTFKKYQEELGYYGFDPNSYGKEDFIQHNITTNQGTNGYLKSKGIPDDLIKKIKQERDKKFYEIVEKYKQDDQWIIDNRMKILEAIQREFADRVRIALVTTSSEKKIKKMHEGSIDPNIFETRITQDDLEDKSRIKPHPDLYKILGKKYPNEPYLAIEDTPRGAQSVLDAKNNGTPYIVKNEFSQNTDIPKGAQVIQFDDIPHIIRQTLQKIDQQSLNFFAQIKHSIQLFFSNLRSNWRKNKIVSRMRSLFEKY